MSARPCGHRWDIPLRDAALQYAEHGYAVLPLEPGSKKPHHMLGYGQSDLANGVHYATSSAAQVIQWWNRDRQANIGIATGDASQLTVVDLDTKKEDGPGAFWAYLRDTQLGFNWTSLVKTPSGGWHCWMRTGGIRERRNILSGVDIKGRGGYVVAAPSVIGYPDGGGGEVMVPYAWHGDGCMCWPPAAPAWFTGWAASAPTTSSAASAGSGSIVPDMDKAKRDGLPEGERNVAFHKLASSYYGTYGLSEETDRMLIADFREVWARTSHKGMTWGEVERCRISARRWIEQRRMEEAAIAADFAASGWDQRYARRMTKRALRRMPYGR